MMIGNDASARATSRRLPDRAIGGSAIVASRVFEVPDRRPAGPGPWEGEADKLAWIDVGTGLHCVILRAEVGGHLCGYVGVDLGHPMFGWDHREIPSGLRVSVHGGLSYSELSDEDGPESTAMRQLKIGEVDDPRWWFGFSCDQPGDLQPRRSAAGECTVGDPLYRDERYVLARCTELAFRLTAVANALDALLAEAPPP
ncbi:hypothetical protein NF699_02150 [Sphingomonadaceae bacterium OTU29LAMAA1]|nr:hypothetical protein NF699_02150 [Sphingomonadaceae bacterium OTU29LAMAA1]